MKRIHATAVLCAAALALAGCGNSTDASEDAMADNVELPADEAMSDAPAPIDDEAMTMDETENDAAEAAAEADAMVSDDVEGAIDDAEETME